MQGARECVVVLACAVVFLCGMYFYMTTLRVDLVDARRGRDLTSLIQESMSAMSAMGGSEAEMGAGGGGGGGGGKPMMGAGGGGLVLESSRCPDVLIQKGSRIFLHNSKHARVPGVNPIVFENLEEYTEFVSWQRSQGISCPVLFLQNAYDAQGNAVYRARPSAHNLQGGLGPALLVDAGRNSYPMNENAMPGFDAENQDVGVFTPLDAMDEREASLLQSTNSMADNWGGTSYSQHFLDRGDFSGNEVYM